MICVVVTVALVIACAACSSGSAQATDLLYAVMGGMAEQPAGHVDFSEADENSDGYADGEKLAKLYDNMKLDGIFLSYALLLPEDDSIYEIHIYRARSEAKALQIEKILYRRVDMLQKSDVYLYNEENYESVISRARVIRRGIYAILLMTDDNSKAAKIIDKQI